MLCGTCVEPGRFELIERPLPLALPEGWAFVDITAVGICGTDYHIYAGKHPFLNYPRVIGHELSGRLVTPAGGLKAGTLVVINPYIACGKCRACLRSKPNCCANIAVLGVHCDGGLCQRIAVPAENLIAADGLDDIQAAMVEFLAIGAHAVARSGLAAGDRVLVTGAGPIGIGTALFARLAGAEVHLLDVSAQRLAIAGEKFGFQDSYDDPSRVLDGDRADGFDTVFDATGAAAAIEAGFPFLAHGSSYVLVSVVKDHIRFDDAEFHKRETRIVGSRNAVQSDFETVMTAMRAGKIPTDALCSVTLSLAELPERFPELARDRSGLIKAIVRV
ncbi:zinc-binding alcohol dehydrogenase family protein [Phyllobacterium sp. 22229]|jgi:2-desacetyl-2-hydroxyethyl bacteriochlorophyllide A dehydrogenase|uniref:zinc-binding alcohol dehydrogenase family protein n=1 Tax=Phyllobacterium sp. 22229 TaxID=3453895 RepID=UPI003F86C7EE